MAGSKSSMPAKPSAPPVLVPPLHLYTPYKQETKTKSVFDCLAKSSARNSSSGHNSSDSSEAEPCSVFAVMYGEELDFGQRIQRELHQHHYSTRSNPI